MKWINVQKAQKDLHNFTLDRILSYFRFYNYWIVFNFCFCIFSWYSNTSSARELKICAITAAIKKYKSIIKKKKKNQDRIVLLAKSKLSSIEDLI